MIDNSMCVGLSHTLPHLILTITLNMHGARPITAGVRDTFSVRGGSLVPPTTPGFQCHLQPSKPTGSNHIKPKRNSLMISIPNT